LTPYFQRTEFLEENSRKSGWPAAHKQSGKVGYGTARPRAINDKGQVIGSARWFGCLSATVDPTQRQQSPVDKDEREQYCTE
jgi:hypothetical protein